MKSFTLAEVLIVLGIIGLIADMTIPTVISSYNKRAASTKIKKFYSTINQAILLSQIDNGPATDWLRENGASGDIYNEDGTRDWNANGKLVYGYFMQYFAPYMRYTSIECADAGYNTDVASDCTVKLADGSAFYLHNGGCVDFQYDINGSKKPNISGRDVFGFYICSGSSGGKLQTVEDNALKTREQALSRCKQRGYSCSRLLQLDDWEFKDDYPYHL